MGQNCSVKNNAVHIKINFLEIWRAFQLNMPPPSRINIHGDTYEM